MTGVNERLFMCQMFMCLFWPCQNLPEKVHVGGLFSCILSQEMRHINFFVLGGQNGGFWVGGKKVYVEHVCMALLFLSLTEEGCSEGDRPKVTDRTETRSFSQIHPHLLEIRVFEGLRNLGEVHWKRGICIKLSEIDFQIRDKFATTLCTFPLMHEMKSRQFCANLARNLQRICATSPRERPLLRICADCRTEARETIFRTLSAMQARRAWENLIKSWIKTRRFRRFQFLVPARLLSHPVPCPLFLWCFCFLGACFIAGGFLG